jgi:5S rRNA maturation endonuclease (ribonuclease M5)
LAQATEYLWGRGIPPFQLRDVEVVVRGGAPMLEFSIRRYDGVETGKVFRALGDDETRYKTTNHGKRRTKGVYATFDITSDQPRHLVITEGAFDAISASLAGYEAISLPLGAKHVKAATDELLELSQFSESVIIATDLDTAGESAAQEILRVLSVIPSLRIRRLRTLKHGKDLNDTLRFFGADAVREALEAAVPVRPLADGWLEPRDWRLEREEPPQYFIESVVTTGSKVLVVGLGETGKSMLLRAVAVAASAPAGVSTAVGPFVVRGGHNVLWINEEVPPHFARQYFRRIQVGMGVGDLSRVHISSMSGFVLDDGDWLNRMRSLLLREPGPWVVFIDSLRPVLGGVDELQGSRVARVLTSLANVLASVDATCFIIAHEAKSTSTPKQSIAGSLAPYNWADDSFRITRSGGESQITWTKNRNARSTPSKSSFRVVDVGSGGLAIETTGLSGTAGGSAGAVVSTSLSSLALEIKALIPQLPSLVSRDAVRKALGQPHLRYGYPLHEPV